MSERLNGELLSLGVLCKDTSAMKDTTILTLVMVFGSSFGGALLAQESVPATPIISASSTETATSGTQKVEAVSDKTGSTVKSQIEVATKAYDKKSDEFSKKLRTETDSAKRNQLYSSRPDPMGTVDMIIKLAKKTPKAEGVEQGLLWSVKHARGDQRKESGDLLLTHYKDSETIGQLAYIYSRMWRGGEDELRQIIAKTGNEKVRQGATYYLASKLVKRDTKSEGISMMKKLQKLPELAETNPKLLEQIKGELFVAENLSVGCKAPDIVGTDHEGKEFKLSDYKGKVVLLDFWGIW